MAEKPSGRFAVVSETDAFVESFFRELAASGVEQVCISPGSRSTPLAAAAQRQPSLRCWSHVDERSAGFFALGMAKASRKPVALVCTSGTAAANFHPAIVEASLAQVPLLVLTADRPPELRDWGAPQTIDQLQLYGGAVRWFVELPVLAGGRPAAALEPALLRYARTLACRAVAEARGERPGPVHLNWPLREPLEPGVDASGEAEGPPAPRAEPLARSVGGARQLASTALAELAERARAVERGVIVCGPMDAAPRTARAIAELGRMAGWPVIADATSQLRRGAAAEVGPVVAFGDLLLRDAEFAAAHPPALVVRFGQAPVSKALRLWLEASPPPEFWLVDDAGAWSEPSQLATRLLRAEAGALATSLRDSLGLHFDEGRHSEWLRSFLAADASVADAVARACDAQAEIFEPRAARELWERLPGDATLYVSNSMPVRDLDGFAPASAAPLRVLANRGANGIDGMVSSALGAAAASSGPTLLFTGDLALLHDLGGLLAARRYELSLSIVVVNNDGGGIFSFLPIAQQGEGVGFEEFFRTPHGVDFARVAALFDAKHLRIESWEHFRSALKESLASPGVQILELPVDRDANLAHFRALVAASRAALRSAEADGNAS